MTTTTGPDMAGMSGKTSALAIVGAFASIVLAILWVALWYGFGLSILWGWFMVPLGLPDIGIAHAYGLILVAALVRPAKLTQNSDDLAKKLGKSFVVPPAVVMVALGAGWVARLWM